MPDLTDRVAVVTGAASGIGKACAEVLAQSGADVVVSDLASSDGEAVAADIDAGDGGDALFVACDVSEPDDITALFDRTVDEFGGLDIGINNAGIRGDMEPLADVTREKWQRVLDVNLTGVFECMRAEIDRMLDDGGGSIVNIASVAGQVGFPNVAAYTAAKHGVVGVTKTAALEYSSRGIRVNAIGPAVIETPMVDDMVEPEESRQQLLDAHPIGRFGTPREVADFAAFLGSDEASFMTGSFYGVDGGYLAQ